MRRVAALILLALLAGAGCGGNGEKDAATESGGVESLDNVLALRSAFEADAGKTRLIVLFSPT